MTAQWKDWQVFGDVDGRHFYCCDCCGGYCSRPDPQPHPDTLFRVMVRGVPYVTDRYVAIRADLVEPTMDPVEPENADLDGRFTVPDREPGPSQAQFWPSRVERLDAAGMRVRDGDSLVSPQPLYLAGEHAGVVMPVSPAADGALSCALGDLPELRAIAADLPVRVNDYPIDTAAKLLAWERGRR